MSESTNSPATRVVPSGSLGKSTIVALVALFATIVITRSFLKLSPDGHPEWAFWFLAPATVLLSSFGIPVLVRELHRGRAGALERSIERLRECALGAALSCGCLLALGLQGQRPVLLFTTMAVCFVIGFGPLLVWRYSPAGKRERRLFASALEGRRFSLSVRGNGGPPRPRRLRRRTGRGRRRQRG